MDIKTDKRNFGSYILGLDVGVASVGWCCIKQPESENGSVEVLRLGSHTFEPGVEGSASDIARGKDVSRNEKRRQCRSSRRQTWRRARRKRLLLQKLREFNLLPRPDELQLPFQDPRLPSQIDCYIKAIDKLLRAQWLEQAEGTDRRLRHINYQKLPYLIRKRAAEDAIDRLSFGRALYHLAQRRGFLSNRRADSRKGDENEKSEMKRHIGELQEQINAHSPATLGAFFASLNPDSQRLRGRWTSRKMYEDEFETIWETQAQPMQLSENAKREIRKAIFYQRPLKSQKHLIALCSLEQTQRRSPVAHRLFQRFRLLQSVNNLTLHEPGRILQLTAEQRSIIISKLCREGDLSFANIRKLLQLPKTTRFNLELDDEKSLIGHRTDAKLRKVFGERFESLSEEERDRLVEDLRSFRQPDALARRGRKHWGLSSEESESFAAVALEDG